MAALRNSPVRIFKNYFGSANALGHLANPSRRCQLNRPEPHILLFRRPLGTDPQSGRVDPELARQARDEYKNQFGLMRK